MCGIAGRLNFDGRPVELDLLDKMVRVIGYRGPDATGLFRDRNVGFGHARLSIIDLEGGQQPMTTADGSFCITFNGEIYNYIELREELLRKGYRFQTCSDTEVILHLYQEKGEDCVRYLNGQWAFAIWDRRKRRLFLSRDRFGVRPLFYTVTNRSFVFASEIKSLLVDAEVPREVDLEALVQIFTFWCMLPPRTFFRGILELPPGHSLTIEDRQESLRTRPYWSLSFEAEDRNLQPETYYADRLWELLLDATRIRLRADVPVGAYLSGGLDSSLITAIIQKLTDTPLKTFSLAFDDPEFDESRAQEEVVTSVGTNHHKVICSSEDIGRNFPQVIWHTEKPILRTAPVPLYLLSGLVHEEGFKVVLTGEGADEIFGGYDIFKEAKIRAFWARCPDSELRPLLLHRLYPYLPALRQQSGPYLRSFFQVNAAESASPFFSHLPRWRMTSQLKRFLAADVQEMATSYNPIAELEHSLPEAFARWDLLAKAQYLEAMHLLPGYILSSQGDRVAMGHSVEVRLPFLDHRVVQFATTLPPTLKMKVLNEKYLLRRCASRLLPASIADRRKQPYRAPESKSFFNSAKLDYVGELLSPERIREDGIFDPVAVTKLKDKFRNGFGIGIKDNMALVGILSTQLVVEQFIRNFNGDSCDRYYEPNRTAVATIHR